MIFKRYKLFYGRTLAWRLFKRHHTHFNDILWAHKMAMAHAYASTRPFSRTDRSDVLFEYATGNRRAAATLGEWADHYSDFDRWTQMASIVAISGYLETYIAQIGVAALESCPSLIFGGGPKLEGAILLKNNPKYDLYPYTEPLVRGDWQARISAYKRLFGMCPFEGAVGDLERLRNLRNDAGHSFGRDIESMKFAAKWLVQPIPRISEEDLQRHLGLVEVVATAIEEHLASSYVGQYEIIKLFHRWVTSVPPPRAGVKTRAKAFSVHVASLTSNPYGIGPGVDLIKYYDSL